MPSHSAPHVTVVDERGKSHELVGWAAYLVGLATSCADQLNATDHGQLVIDFGPANGMTMNLRSELGRIKQRP